MKILLATAILNLIKTRNRFARLADEDVPRGGVTSGEREFENGGGLAREPLTARDATLITSGSIKKNELKKRMRWGCS